jgi:hypothetical protein
MLKNRWGSSASPSHHPVMPHREPGRLKVKTFDVAPGTCVQGDLIEDDAAAEAHQTHHPLPSTGRVLWGCGSGHYFLSAV